MSHNPLAWCAWATAALAAAFIDRNPYLQFVLLMIVLNVWLPNRGQAGAATWKLGLMLAGAPVIFSVALSRFGHHVLVRLPEIPIVGGAWTLEALAFGASSGVALLLVVGVFSLLQGSVRSGDLVAMLPAPLYRAGTVFALALAFAPQTVSAFHAISEARQLRGRRSGWRAAPTLLVPLLLTTLERALQYGESLDARGFGDRRRSRYRRSPWRWGDALVVAGSVASLILILSQPSAGYSPYAQIVPRVPSPATFLPILLLIIPAVLAATRPVDHAADLV